MAKRQALSDRDLIALILRAGVTLRRLSLRRTVRAIPKVAILEGVHCSKGTLSQKPVARIPIGIARKVFAHQSELIGTYVNSLTSRVQYIGHLRTN